MDDSCFFQKTIDISFKDYKNFNDFHYRKWKLKYIHVLIFTILLTVSVYLSGDGDQFQVPDRGIGFYIFLMVIWAIVLSIISLVAFYAIKFIIKGLLLILMKLLYYRTKKNANNVLFSLSAKCVETQTHDGGIVTAVSWERLLHTYETPTAYYFYISKNTAFILFKRYFLSTDELLNSQEQIIRLSKDKYKYIPIHF